MMTVACEDDFKTGYGNVGEGMSQLDVTVDFDVMNSVTLNSRSAVGSGTTMDGISSFYMVIYNEDITKTFVNGQTYKCIKVFSNGSAAVSTDPDCAFSDVKYSLEDNRLPSESELQNNQTGRLTFKLQIPSDRYRVYGVANVPNLEDYDLSTPDKLKSIERTWIKNDEVDLLANSEMFGIFSVAPNREAPEQAIPLQSGGATMHCWLKRLASKLTVSFDGSDLFDDVQIFITDIKVHDIAKKCQLGNPNTPGLDLTSDTPGKMHPAACTIRYDLENGLIEDGGTIQVQPLPEDFNPMLIDPNAYIHVCNNSHPYNSKGENGTDISIRDNRHKTDAQSFFFYENRQGTGDSKFQDANGDGQIDTPNWAEVDGDEGWKDKKPYGTWVEVSGFYRCTTAAMGSNPHLGHGPIKYRFMLGEDIENDYNVNRNTHYKLTLKFKGYGNDADWHIQYNEKPGISAKSPVYISYLYNKRMMLPVKIKGRLASNYLYAYIIGTDNLPKDFPAVDKSQETDQTWWRPWGDNSPNFPDPKNETDNNGKPIYFNGYINSGEWPDGPWNSFLTLREVKTVRIVDVNGVGRPSYADGRDSKYNRIYFQNMKSGFAKYNIVSPRTDGHDEYSFEAGGTNPTGIYTSEPQISGDQTLGYVVNIPLYTRAKELLTSTGFSGNNPYSAYPRRMRVGLKVQLYNESGQPEWFTSYVDVIQVRRLENPKGVWRRAGSTEGFHVRLMRMMDIDGKDDYQPFKSEGKWSAEVVGDPIITLSTTADGSGDNAPMNRVRHIEGETDHYIDFQINFTGASGCGGVKIRYHNYTCEHDIFCREGYEPIALADGSYTHPLANTTTPYRKWSTCNVYSFKSDGTPEYGESPLDPGSLFRRGSYTAILSTNETKYPFPAFHNISPSNIPNNLPQTAGKDPSTGNLDVLTKGSTTVTKSTWANISSESDAIYNDWTIAGSERIATIEDFYTLANPGDPTQPKLDLDFVIKKAYGVVYADGAVDTQATVAMAHGYTHEDGANSPKGMRGIIVYNMNDMRQIFLPMGASGYGRRKGVDGWNPSPADVPGTLRYASRAYYSDLKDADVTGLLRYAPMFYDIFRRPGAIYWCKERENGSVGLYKSSAFDINYFSMGFEGFTNGAAAKKPADGGDNSHNSDALYIRTVSD